MTDALIVIDMQQGSFGPATPRHDAAGLVGRLNRLAREVRTDGGAVDLHPARRPARRPAPSRRSPAGACCRRSSPAGRHGGAQTLLRRLSHTTLDDLLRERGIDRLIVTGCATDYCVDTTVRSALGRGWPTIVPSDGHTTADRPHLPADADHRASQRDLGRFPGARGPARVCPVHRGAVIHLTALERLAGHGTCVLNVDF